MKVVILSKHIKEIKKHIKPVDGIEFFYCTDESDAIDAEVLYCHQKLSPEFYKKAKTLNWIQFAWAGVDYLKNDVPKKIILARTPGVASQDIARYVSVYALYFAENLEERFSNQKKKEWSASSDIDRKFDYKVGVFGLGELGRGISLMLNSIGFTVNGYRRTNSKPDFVSKLFSSKEELLKISDFVILALPDTKETNNFITKKELGLMKKNAVLINVGRGSAVNEKDLSDSLENKEIKAAVLDVFIEEPLPKDSKLWTTRNLIITPHIAGPYTFDKRIEFFLENLGKYIKGERLMGIVDLERGY